MMDISGGDRPYPVETSFQFVLKDDRIDKAMPKKMKQTLDQKTKYCRFSET